VSMSSGTIVEENARSVAHKPLPPAPPLAGRNEVSLVLFYQYMQPLWSEAEHRKALKTVIGLAQSRGIKGRGRCAREGLNCSLTGPAKELRAFCQGLRDWNSVFDETDFKFTDGIPVKQGFKALTIRKTDELVAYGLEGEKLPLTQSSAQHVEATEFHTMLEEPNAVVIDVRNHYESAIGAFAPPEGGAELIDPKMRNSHEFPKWLNDEKTREKLNGKKVMMYCTGGIRCERATALLDHLEKKYDDFSTDGIVMVRGGIERYVRTFPEGGYWSGKNYLFDRRFEQAPELKPTSQLRREVKSKCCVCSAPWDTYRGQHRCAGMLPPPVSKLCDVPVLVCSSCFQSGAQDQVTLLCPLCAEGHVAPQSMPLEVAAYLPEPEPAAASAKRPPEVLSKAKRKRPSAEPSSRLFVGSLPFIVDAQQLRSVLSPSADAVAIVHWLRDHKTRLFYGSAFVGMSTLEAATTAVDKAASEAGLVLGGRRLRVAFAPPREGEAWPPEGHTELERPPLT